MIIRLTCPEIVKDILRLPLFAVVASRLSDAFLEVTAAGPIEIGCGNWPNIQGRSGHNDAEISEETRTQRQLLPTRLPSVSSARAAWDKQSLEYALSSGTAVIAHQCRLAAELGKCGGVNAELWMSLRAERGDPSYRKCAAMRP